MVEAPDIPGAADVVAWFGYWPDFHDSEVLSIKLDRSIESEVSIYAFEMTPEIDNRGYYVLAKHAIVTFLLQGFPRDRFGITNTRIEFFNSQNVLGSASVLKREDHYELILEACFGADCRILCERISVKVEPYTPPASQD